MYNTEMLCRLSEQVDELSKCKKQDHASIVGLQSLVSGLITYILLNADTCSLRKFLDGINGNSAGRAFNEFAREIRVELMRREEITETKKEWQLMSKVNRDKE